MFSEGVTNEKTSTSKYSAFHGCSNFSSASLHCYRVPPKVIHQLSICSNPLPFLFFFGYSQSNWHLSLTFLINYILILESLVLWLTYKKNCASHVWRGSLFRLLQRNTSKLDWRRRVHMALDIVSTIVPFLIYLLIYFRVGIVVVTTFYQTKNRL